jgi:hypothetical protein
MLVSFQRQLFSLSSSAVKIVATEGQNEHSRAAQNRDVFVLALDAQPVAFTGPHGQSLDWFD